MRLFSPDSAHWYQRDGTALHSVPAANGELRRTTLRDARKLGLVPSVTNILGVIAKPELTLWLQEQAVLAALTLPRLPGESEDAFALRVVRDSGTMRDSAAEFGTAFHEGAETVAATLEVDAKDPQAPWLSLYRDWYQENIEQLVWTERTLVCAEVGFAGTADLLARHRKHGLVLVDLKTQRVKPGAKLSAYKSWCYQLAAYRRALNQPVGCMNVVVNSREPSAPVEIVWSSEDLGSGWAAFEAAHKIWCIEKAFDPRMAPPSGVALN